MVLCFTSVFASLVEFAFVHFMERTSNRRLNQLKMKQEKLKEEEEEEEKRARVGEVWVVQLFYSTR